MTKLELFSRLRPIPFESKKVLLLTHTDLDGAGAAVLTNLAFIHANVTVKHCNNNTMSKDILKAVMDNNIEETYDLVLATDISMNEDDAHLADTYIGSEHPFLLFDHHPTAMHLNKYNWACVYSDKIDDSRRAAYFEPEEKNWHTSATGLLYDYLDCEGYSCVSNLADLDYFAHAVSAYDTWDWKNAQCTTVDIEDMNALCYLYEIEDFEDKMISRLANRERFINSLDREALAKERKKIDAYLKNLKPYIATGELIVQGRKYSYAGCISTVYVAQVFEFLRKNYTNCELLLVNTGSSLSMRTNDNSIDLSAIAKYFNGGGHRAAAGFPITEEARADMITRPFGSHTITRYFE